VIAYNPGQMDLPAEPQIRWMVRRTAGLLRLGAEPVRGLVLPTGEFFPDRFDGSPASVAALMARVQDHAGLSDLDVELAIVSPEGEAQTVSCSSGACGGTGKIDARLDRITRRNDGSYRVALGAGEVRNATVLTTAMIRSVGFMFMTESGAYDDLPGPEREPATDLVAVLLGFGVLVANGSYIYAKGCGGVQVHSATRMPVDETTLALAIFCKLHQVPERTAAKHLEVTPREHLDEAMVWADSNAAVMRQLRADPEAVEDDDFALSPAGSWLSRLFKSKKPRATRPTEDDLAELERTLAVGQPKKQLDPARAKRLAEIRDLVDESLES